MTETLSNDWERFERLAAETNQRNKAIVFDALSKTGITHVRVQFDGEGDQGQMDRASAQADGSAVEFPTIMLTLQIAQFGRAELTVREMNLQEAVEQLCYDCLEQKHRRWEDNEGSFGEFVFDVTARTVTLDYYGRIIDHEHHNHSF